MAAHPHFVFYLIFRVPLARGSKIPWDHPTGGLIVDRLLVERHPGIAGDLARDRFHISPQEILHLAEVWEREDVKRASTLFHAWEVERHEFAALMRA